MSLSERLSEIDRELDGFDRTEDQLAGVLERVAQTRPADLAAADADNT